MAVLTRWYSRWVLKSRDIDRLIELDMSPFRADAEFVAIRRDFDGWSVVLMAERDCEFQQIAKLHGPLRTEQEAESLARAEAESRPVAVVSTPATRVEARRRQRQWYQQKKELERKKQ